MTNKDESLQTVEIQNVELADFDCSSVERNNDLFEKIIKAQEDLHKRFGSSASRLQKLYSKLNKISSEGQKEASLKTAGNKISLRHRAGAAINVQPTSIVRRSGRSLRSGRPASGVSVKRSHSLSVNIKLNKQNAKCMGMDISSQQLFIF
ncbi:hypothetical protein AVEN_114250-1 [Araneus ventricosus]|uniref:Uncharacterized protein n=1 Tax=Araneus ventricosus TaxID=182803 RepID=A0A4Y2MFF7_ARAVE|nr:hypothetical protein AVEN_114250-1 [Araneus ventricosus]